MEGLRKELALLVSGDNDFGQLCTGNNKSTKKLIEPKLPPEMVIQQVAVGYDHTLILTDKNELYVCGSNAYGKLGMGDVEEIIKPQKVNFQTPKPFAFETIALNNKTINRSAHGYGTLRKNNTTISKTTLGSFFQSSTDNDDKLPPNIFLEEKSSSKGFIPKLNLSNTTTNNDVHHNGLVTDRILAKNNGKYSTICSPVFSPEDEILMKRKAVHMRGAHHSGNVFQDLIQQQQQKLSEKPIQKRESVKEVVSKDCGLRLSVSGEDNRMKEFEMYVSTENVSSYETGSILDNNTNTRRISESEISTNGSSPTSNGSLGIPSPLNLSRSVPIGGSQLENSINSNTDNLLVGDAFSPRRHSESNPPMPNYISKRESVKSTSSRRSPSSMDFDASLSTIDSEGESSDEETVTTHKKSPLNGSTVALKGSMSIRRRKERENDGLGLKDFLSDLSNKTAPTKPTHQKNLVQILDERVRSKPPFEIKTIFCSRNNSFIVTKDDEVYWCGDRAKKYFTKFEDEELNGKKIKLFATSSFSDHFVIVTTKNEFLVSGNNSNGQLGDGTTLDCYGFLKKLDFPFEDDFEEEKRFCTFKNVACGRAHTCVIVNLNGKYDVFYSTGCNQYSQLGYALPPERYVFENPPSLPFERKEIKDLSCGAQHTMVLTIDGELWACGKGDLGQLGNQSFSPKNEFQKIELPSSYALRRVFCGGGYTILLTNDNVILRSGGNYYGQIFHSGDQISEFKEYVPKGNPKVFAILPTTLFCVLVIVKSVKTSPTTRRSERDSTDTTTSTTSTSGTITNGSQPSTPSTTSTTSKFLTLKPGMFDMFRRSKNNLKLDLDKVKNEIVDDDSRPNTTR
ncbi:hypothetical protein ABK040_010891 [Willaertia magna]